MDSTPHFSLKIQYLPISRTFFDHQAGPSTDPTTRPDRAAPRWDLVVWMLRSPSERRRVFGPSWGGACHASPGPTIQNPDGLIKQGIKEKDEEIRTGKDRKKQAYCLDQSGRTIDIHLRIQPIRNFMKFRRSARIILATIVRYRKYLNYFEL